MWPSDEQLLLARATMGISEAFYIPAALALIADYHRGGTRSRAVGMHQMGIYAGVIIGGFSGYAADRPNLGWRWMFALCGLAGVLYAVPLFLLLRNAPRAEDVSEPKRTSPAGALRELLGNPSFSCWFCISPCLRWRAGLSAAGCPRFLKTEFGIGQGKAGVWPHSIGCLRRSWRRLPAVGLPIAGRVALRAAAFIPARSGCS